MLILLYQHHPFELFSFFSIILIVFFGFGYLFLRLFGGLKEDAKLLNFLIYFSSSIVITILSLYIAGNVIGLIILDGTGISLFISLLCGILSLSTIIQSFLIKQDKHQDQSFVDSISELFLISKKAFSKFFRFLKAEKSFLVLFVAIIIVFVLFIPLSFFYRLSQSGYSYLIVKSNDGDIIWTDKDCFINEEIGLIFIVQNNDYIKHNYSINVFSNNTHVHLIQSDPINAGRSWNGNFNLSFTIEGRYFIKISLYIDSELNTEYLKLVGWIKVNDD